MAGVDQAGADHRVGLIGISFSGGLTIVAAGRPSIADRIAYVLSFGGHDDLPRVLQYLCTGVEPRSPIGSAAGRHARATGPTSLRRGRRTITAWRSSCSGSRDRMVPPAQVEPLRAAVRRFCSRRRSTARRQAAGGPRSSTRCARSAKPCQSHPPRCCATSTSATSCTSAPRLLPYVTAYGGDPALSPSRSPKPTAPVFLLHGMEDNVIPAVESEYLAEDLRGRAPVRLC